MSSSDVRVIPIEFAQVRGWCDGSKWFDLLAYLTAQRVAELWWARENERRLFAAGGVEFGRSHLLLIVLLHASWIMGLWSSPTSVRSIHSSRPRWSCCKLHFGCHAWAALDDPYHCRSRREIGGGGLYRFLRHPTYAVVTGEIAAVPLALDLPRYALIFSILNAAVLAIRIPEENAALAASARTRRR